MPSVACEMRQRYRDTPAGNREPRQVNSDRAIGRKQQMFGTEQQNPGRPPSDKCSAPPMIVGLEGEHMTKRRPLVTDAKAADMDIGKRIEPFLNALDELLGDTIWQCIEDKLADPYYHSVAMDVTAKFRRVRELRAAL
jgi:hypothetical protein